MTDLLRTGSRDQCDPNPLKITARLFKTHEQPARTNLSASIRRTMDTNRNRTALVTGASGGIGLELARCLAADGYRLIVVGRNRDRLQQSGDELRHRYEVPVRCAAADLSDPSAVRRLWSDVQNAGDAVDVLVNNAGVGLYGALDGQDPDQLERMVQLNVLALTMLTRFVLPDMLARRWGRILNVASVVAFQPGSPWMATYYASKSYVLSFSKGLARELDGTGVSVTALCPGPTETAFDATAGTAPDLRYTRAPRMSAPDVARAGYSGMMRSSPVVVPGFMTKLLALAGELPPRRIALEVNRWIWKPRQ